LKDLSIEMHLLMNDKYKWTQRLEPPLGGWGLIGKGLRQAQPPKVGQIPPAP